MGHLVDKEQGQYLDPLMEQLALPLNMRKDRFPDLYAPYLVLADLADHVPCKDLEPVDKGNGIVPAVDEADGIVVPILLHAVGVVIQIVPDAHGAGDLLDGGPALAVELDRGRGVRLGKVDALQVYEPLRAGGAGLGDAFYGDLLH